MAAWTVVSRQASNLARLSIAKSAQSSSLIPRRGLASGGDHHGPPRVNFWEDPMSPSKWKEEHMHKWCKWTAIVCLIRAYVVSQFVIVSLTGWGLLLFGGYKIFTGGKKEKKEEKVEGAH